MWNSDRQSAAGSAGDLAPLNSGNEKQEESAAYSPDEIRALDVAKMYLTEDNSKQFRAIYSVRRTDEGFSVFVEYQPAFPGGHCVILISRDFKVTKVVGGA